MAFAFFRRRQKMVVVIMAALMVSFLVGMQGFQMLTARDPGRAVIARTNSGEIRREDMAVAGADLAILRDYVALHDSRYIQAAPGFEFFLRIHELDNPRGEASVLRSWTLLLKEAEHAGIEADRQEAKEYLETDLRIKDQAYELLLNRLRIGRHGFTEKRLLLAVAHWLMIGRSFTAQLLGAPVMESEARLLFRDLTAQVNLQVLKIPANDYVDKVGEPTDKQIAEMFAEHRGNRARYVTSKDSFGFGYYQPDRVRICYLEIDREAIGRVTEPDPKEVAAYYDEHRDEFFKEVPVARTQPVSSPATAPSSQPVKTRRAPLSYHEAKSEIIKALRKRAADRRIDGLIESIEKRAKELAADGKADPCRAIVEELALSDQMKAETAAVLATKLPAAAVKSITGTPLDQAMKVLAEAAGMQAICYPWGAYENVEILQDVAVSLDKEAMMLGEALDDITGQVFPRQQSGQAGAETKPAKPKAKPKAEPPKLEWALCRGIGDANIHNGDVLFCIGGNTGASLFPLRAGRTDLVSQAELATDPVLGSCRTSAGGRADQDLARIAMMTPAAERDDRAAARVKTGQFGPPMYAGPGSQWHSRVLWQLTESSPAAEPEKLTPKLRDQVIKDWKIREAFKTKVKPLAEKVRTEAEELGLPAAARDNGLDAPLETGLFPKFAHYVRENVIEHVSPPEERAILASPAGQPWILQALQARETSLLTIVQRDWRLIGQVLRLPGLRVVIEPMFDEAFIPPARIEPPANLSEPGPVIAMSFPAARTAVVMRRIEYRPAMLTQYRGAESGDQVDRSSVVRYLERKRTEAAAGRWFSYRQIEKRLAYKEDPDD